MDNNNNIYYDWNKTFTYDAPVNIIVSARGLGKTYGLRKAAIKDFIKDGSRFVEITRYKSALSGEDAIQRGYFDKLIVNNEFPEYEFNVQGTKAYIRKEGSKKWDLIGYFVALSDMQKSKQRTFANVKKVIFDEFIVDKRTRARYLPGEFSLFSNLVDSLARETVNQDGTANGTKIHIYLLGNACDLTNPYFMRWKIDKIPNKGYTWHAGKLVLIHYVESKEYSRGKKNTLVGKLVSGTAEENVIVDNVFNTGDTYNIAKKTKYARFEYGIIYCGNKFGVWFDTKKGCIYINDKVPEGSGKEIYALTREDNGANYLQVRNSEGRLKSLMDLYYCDVLRFSSPSIRDKFMESLNAFGIR